MARIRDRKRRIAVRVAKILTVVVAALIVEAAAGWSFGVRSAGTAPDRIVGQSVCNGCAPSTGLTALIPLENPESAADSGKPVEEVADLARVPVSISPVSPRAAGGTSEKELRALVKPLVPVVIAGANGANLRTGPGTHYERVGYLEPRARISVIGRYGDWWQVEVGGTPMWVFGGIVVALNVGGVPEVEPPSPPPVATAPAVSSEIGLGRWIDIDLARQVLTAYEDSVPVRTVLVSTGLPATPTPVGQYRIWVKFVHDDMEGPGYYLPDVPYVMYFYGGYGLHGVYWHANFGQPMSHGCVNMPTPEAEWLFNWVDVGTLVNVHS
jgi:hypothetical protein